MTREEEQINLDLDALSFTKRIKNSDDETMFYIRTDDKKISSCFGGQSVNLVNSVIDLMTREEEAYDLLSSAVSLFEEDSIPVIEEEGEVVVNNVFEQYNLVTSALVTMFAAKHNCTFDGWETDNLYARFDACVLFMGDIAYDLEQDIPNNVIWEYEDANTEEPYSSFASDYEENTMYCDNCNSACKEDTVVWSNSQPVCQYCGGALKL